MKSAVFLDRDGTICERPSVHSYVTNACDFRLLPGSVAAMVSLAQAGYLLILVSNQRGVARGLVKLSVLADIELIMQQELRLNGCGFTSFHYCCHEIDDHCECRKPRPGLILTAAKACGVSLDSSWMVGDAESDVSAGRAAGCRSARIALPGSSTSADIARSTIGGVADAILRVERN